MTGKPDWYTDHNIVSVLKVLPASPPLPGGQQPEPPPLEYLMSDANSFHVELRIPVADLLAAREPAPHYQGLLPQHTGLSDEAMWDHIRAHDAAVKAQGVLDRQYFQLALRCLVQGRNVDALLKRFGSHAIVRLSLEEAPPCE